MGPWNFFYKRGLVHPGLGAVAEALAELDCPLLGVGGRLEMEHAGGMTPPSHPMLPPLIRSKVGSGNDKVTVTHSWLWVKGDQPPQKRALLPSFPWVFPSLDGADAREAWRVN